VRSESKKYEAGSKKKGKMFFLDFSGE
jgi:hypothetical protein